MCIEANLFFLPPVHFYSCFARGVLRQYHICFTFKFLFPVTYVQYFGGKESASSCMCLLSGVGSALMYFFSRFMCVNAKIITLISSLLVAAICYAGAERRDSRKGVSECQEEFELDIITESRNWQETILQ